MGFLTKLRHSNVLAARTKAQTDPEKFLQSTVSIIDGGPSSVYGKPWPFDYHAAMVQAQSWVYAAAMGNARTAASVPLRLFARTTRTSKGKAIHPTYTRDNGDPKEPAHPTRKVSHETRRYLKGRLAHKPSMTVQRKVMAFGEDFEEVTDHPLLQLFRKVNPVMDGYQFAVLRFASQEITGNFYMHPIMGQVMGRTLPIELWPMLPHYVRILVAEPNTNELVRGYVYGSDGSNRQTFEPDEVCHFKYVNPDQLIYGLGKVEAAWSAIHLLHAKRTADIAFFENNARPDFLLTAKPGSNPDQMDRLDSKISKLLRGARKAGRWLSVTGDITVTPMQFPPKDAGLGPDILEELAAVFGYPITKLKGNDPNRANAEQGDLTHMRDTILPMLRGDEEKINQWLETFDDTFANGDAVFAYDDPVPVNQVEKRLDELHWFNTGQQSSDELGAGNGFEPHEGGASPLVSAGLVKLEDVGKQPAGLFGGLSGFGGAQGSPGAGLTLQPAGGGLQLPGAPKPDGAAENVVAGEKLNGAQITAAVEVLDKVTTGQTPPEVGKELLIAVGIDEERASRMIDSVVKFEPTTPPATSGKMRGNVQGGTANRDLGESSSDDRRGQDHPAPDAVGGDVHGQPGRDSSVRQSQKSPGDTQATGPDGNGSVRQGADTASPGIGSAGQPAGPDEEAARTSIQPGQPPSVTYQQKLFAVPKGASLIARDALDRQRMKLMQPPDIHVKVDVPPAPAPNVIVNVPEQPAPIVNIPAPVVKVEPVINVTPEIVMPMPDKKVTFETDKQGQITGADIQTEGT